MTHERPWYEATAINTTERLALLADGRTVPLHTMFDAAGEETNDPNAAVSAAAPLPDGTWIAINLKAFERVETH